MTRTLVAIRKVTARTEVLTGLHIGAGDLEMRIGGIDNPVIRDAEGFPYIPGSSLKGKMRSLLEWRSGALMGKGPLGTNHQDEWKDPRAEKILRLFGIGGGDAKEDAPKAFMPTRLSVADAPLSRQFRDRARNAPLVQGKYEVRIDRIQGTAADGGLRQTERVVPGVSFDFTATIRVFDGDPDLVALLLEGMALVELDALGGSGSRGYGKVAFRDVTVDGEDRSLPDPFALAA